MKKYLIVLAAAVFALASCGPKEKQQEEEGGNEYTSISFKKAELTLAIGDTVRLNLLYEPTSLDAPKATWASSNESVVTVDNGTVVALAAGEANITAKVGDLTAVCKATVADPRTLYSWGGIARFSDLTPAEGDTLPIYDVELSDGVYKCYYGMATYYFWDDGVYISGNSLAGEGYLFAMDVPCFVIAEGEYEGAGVGSPIYFINQEFNPADTAYAYCVQAGSLGDVNDWADVVLNENYDKFYDCWKGPECLIYSDGFYYPSFPGILTAGYIYGNYQTMRAYNFTATWADEYKGLAIDESGEALKEPYEWATITCDYVLQANAAPQAKMAKKVNTKNLKKAVMPNKVFKTSDKLVLKK